MKPEIKEKITATNQKYLKKFLTEKEADMMMFQECMIEA